MIHNAELSDTRVSRYFKRGVFCPAQLSREAVTVKP